VWSSPDSSTVFASSHETTAAIWLPQLLSRGWLVNKSHINCVALMLIVVLPVTEANVADMAEPGQV
jgi:hypothetical protein